MNRPSVLALLHLWGRLAARPPSRVVELALDMLRAHEKAENRNHTDAANPSVTAAPCHLHSQGDGDSHAAKAAVRCSPRRGGFGIGILPYKKPG